MSDHPRALSLSLVLVFGACAPATRGGTNPAATSPPSPSAFAPPAQPSAAFLDDPRMVRCGVDDSPIDVLGERRDGQNDRGFLGFRGRSTGPRDPSFLQDVPPGLNDDTPLDPGTTVLAIEEMVRDGRTVGLDELPTGLGKKNAQGGTDEPVACGFSADDEGSSVELEARLTALGAPHVAVARGPSLTPAQSACLGALACRVSLKPSERSSSLRVRGTLRFTAPVFRGEARAITRTDRPEPRRSTGSFTKLDRAITLVLQACVVKAPPAQSFFTVLVTRPGAKGRRVLDRDQLPTGSAARALVRCVAAQLDGLPPIEGAVAKGQLNTTLVVERWDGEMR